MRATHADRVVIETDAGTIRDLPAGYVAEHLEHAYCLTGHGMQGGTVEHATVLASVRDLTKGWSYTALSRARGQTSCTSTPARPRPRSSAASSAAPTTISHPTARRSSLAPAPRC